MPTCIYCRATQDQPFAGVDHVIPEAFWPYNQPRCVIDCVCDECNGYFGRGIEQSLARDSVEGLLRVNFDVRLKQKGVRFGRNRLKMAVNEASDWRGVRVFGERLSRGKGVVFSPQPTVMVRRMGDTGWKFVPEADLSKQVLEPYLPDPQVLVCGPAQEDTQRLQRTLAELGIKPKGWASEPRTGLAAVFANSVCDDTILRALAKVAFNFLACVRGAPFALETDFDAVRNYVRDGARRAGPLVRVITIHISGGGDRLRPRHAVVLNWDVQKTAILCAVTLFGYMLYQVTLCEDYPVWHPMSEGRIFDLRTRGICRIPALDLWPPDAWTHLFWGNSVEP